MRSACTELMLRMARSAGPAPRPAQARSSGGRRSGSAAASPSTFCSSVASSPSASADSGSEATSTRLALTRTSMPSCASMVAATTLAMASFLRRSPTKAWQRRRRLRWSAPRPRARAGPRRCRPSSCGAGPDEPPRDRETDPAGGARHDHRPPACSLAIPTSTAPCMPTLAERPGSAKRFRQGRVTPRPGAPPRRRSAAAAVRPAPSTRSTGPRRARSARRRPGQHRVRPASISASAG